MRYSFLLVGLASLLLVGCSGGGGGLVCGDGTEEVEGECLVGTGDAGTAPNGPADRRLCDSPFGPVGADALFVDAAYAGTDSDGSQEHPFTQIQPAILGATVGQEIGIAAGTYSGDLNIESSLILEGRCANDVIIDGSIHVQNTGGVAIRGLTVQNGTPGILVDDVQPSPGEDFGLQVRFVRATQNDGAGIEMNSSFVQILDSEFTLNRAAGNDLRQLGSGVFVNNGSKFDLSTSYINMNGFMGVDIADATGLPQAVVNDGSAKATATVASTGYINMNGIIGNPGGGIRVGGAPSGLPAELGPPTIEILGNEFSANGSDTIAIFSTGVAISGNSLSGDSSSNRGIRLAASSGSVTNNQIDGFASGGLFLGGSRGVSIGGNSFVNNVEFGIMSLNGKGISISGNTIASTKKAPNKATGHGIYLVADDDINKVGTYELTANIVSDNEGVGIVVNNLDIGNAEERIVSMNGNTVARNALMGIDIRETRAVGMFGNTVTDNIGYGLRCVDGPGSASRVFFDGNVLTGTLASGSGLDGDGVLMSNCHISVDLNQILGNARNGVVLDNGTDGGCDDNEVSGHGLADPNVHDIILQDANITPNVNGGADIQDGVVNLNTAPVSQPG